MPAELKTARPDIIKYLNSLPRQVFDRSDIETILQEQGDSWHLAKTTTTETFISFLEDRTQLHIERFDFSYRPITKYVWGKVPLYTLLLSLRPGCYLTHSTAMGFHKLTDRIPEVINVNVEQAPKPRYGSSELVQEGIDLAFANRTRMSHNTAEYEGHTIRLLNGLHTGNTGVIEMPGPEGEMLRITDVERTLIDIAVRPEYSGGVFDVLEAYKRATDRVSIERGEGVTPTHLTLRFRYGHYTHFEGEMGEPSLDGWRAGWNMVLCVVRRRVPGGLRDVVRLLSGGWRRRWKATFVLVPIPCGVLASV